MFEFESKVLLTFHKNQNCVCAKGVRRCELSVRVRLRLLLPATPLLDLEPDDHPRPEVVVGQRVGVLQEDGVKLKLHLARRHPGLVVKSEIKQNVLKLKKIYSNFEYFFYNFYGKY